MSNPVLVRELRTGLRGHRAFFLRTAFVGVLAVVIIITWMTAIAGMAGTWKGAAVDVRAIPGLGRQLFAALGTALLVLLLALIPGYAAGAISGERETRTLEMMLCTWLRPRNIVLGKLGASTVFAIGLILSSLPAVSAVFLLGGVSPLEVALFFILLLATSVFVGALSLFVSSQCTKTYMAVMLTYLLIGCLHIAGPIGAEAALWFAIHGQPSARIASSIRDAAGRHPRAADLVNPIVTSRSLFGGSVADVAGRQSEVDPRTLGSGDEQVQFVLLHSISPAVMLLGAVLLVAATSRAISRTTHAVGPSLSQRFARWLNRHARVEAPSAPASTSDRASPGIRSRVRRGPSPWRRVADRVGNPVLARDLRGRPLGSSEIILRAGLYGFVAAELAMLFGSVPYMSGRGTTNFLYADFSSMVMAGAVLVVAFLSSIPAAMSIAVEKEQGTLEMVLATLLRPGTILWGKLAAAFWQAQPLILLALPLGVLSAALDVVPWRSAGCMLVLTEAFALAACAIGVLASLLARRPARAVSTTLCILAALVVGPIILRRLGITPGAHLPDPVATGIWLGPVDLLHAAFSATDGQGALLVAGVVAAVALVAALAALAAALALFGRSVRRTIESA